MKWPIHGGIVVGLFVTWQMGCQRCAVLYSDVAIIGCV